MKLFRCEHCRHLVYFENTACGNCSHRLGFIPSSATLATVQPAEGDAWRRVAGAEAHYRFCDNEKHGSCNWLIPIASEEKFCLACRHNQTIPDLSVEANLQAWRKIETAKHRLFYSLIRLKLPLGRRESRQSTGLAFQFLSSPSHPAAPRVMTGHVNGLITIALEEADDVERERRRTALEEPYRTLLGHFRHEVGHYYWDRLVRDAGKLHLCREIFGDDRIDYAEALKRHYVDGVSPDWQENFITSYASAHPWEDFAETWAHYLNIIDTLEMAGAFGLDIRPRLDETGLLQAAVDFDPYSDVEFQTILNAWIPLSITLNTLSRSMGHTDPYPFVLSPAVANKLNFIHGLVHS